MTGADPGSSDVSDATSGEPVSRWQIQPEPTDEELVALVTTLSLLRRRVVTVPEPSPEGSRWAKAGRTAALVPWSRVPGIGWGQGGSGQGQT